MAQVTSLFSREGWIVEKTSADYGEDLCVQICKCGQISYFRLYVQVKGTLSLQTHKGEGCYRVSGVKSSTLDRWLNASYIIVLILWDITKEVGVYAFVDDLQIDPNRRRINSRTITIKIPAQNGLDKSGLTALRVRSILKDVKSEGLKALGSISLTLSDTVRSKEIEKSVNLAIRLLCDLELIEQEEIDGESLISSTSQCKMLFAQHFGKKVADFIESGGDEEKFTTKKDELMWISCVLVILSQVKRLAKDGVHLTIVRTAAPVLFHYFERFFRSFSLRDVGSQ